ncbi:hypothetical protein [Cucumibacter marinus]|uniref:hypothetical protein n=1 Tax=Cucumibacter marinus TaxID=1121252 RepID=UPI00041CE427|nr:hypothetical protein [Cucumibacter marinus]
MQGHRPTKGSESGLHLPVIAGPRSDRGRQPVPPAASFLAHQLSDHLRARREDGNRGTVAEAMRAYAENRQRLARRMPAGYGLSADV